MKEYTQDDIQVITPLEAVALRPGMYWNESLNPFYALVAFLAGYTKAIKNQRLKSIEGDSLFIPDEFHGYVAEHYGSVPNQRWDSFIEQHTETPEEAVKTLVRLRIAYDHRQNKLLRPTDADAEG